jgi:hypothetical protein
VPNVLRGAWLRGEQGDDAQYDDCKWAKAHIQPVKHFTEMLPLCQIGNAYFFTKFVRCLRRH